MIYCTKVIALRAAYLQAIASGDAGVIRTTMAALGEANRQAYYAAFDAAYAEKHKRNH